MLKPCKFLLLYIVYMEINAYLCTRILICIRYEGFDDFNAQVVS